MDAAKSPAGGSMAANPLSQFECFMHLQPEFLELETVDAHTFESRHVWCPTGRAIMYGGQLIAHTVEAAHRTVDCAAVCIHSLRITFASPGRAMADASVRYTVTTVRDGRTFALRSIRVTQRDKLLLVAIASFHKPQTQECVHEMAPPRFARGADAGAGSGARGTAADTKAAFQQRLSFLQQHQQPLLPGPPRQDAQEPVETAHGISLTLLNLLTPPDLGSAYSKDVWMRAFDGSLQVLAARSGIPTSRIHLIVACWLSDVIVALASLFPYGYPDVTVRMMASLDHCLYMHNIRAMNMAEWFVFEVRSSWASSGIALNHGRLYGSDGTLWMSIAQQTVARLRPASSAKPSPGDKSAGGKL